MQSGLTAETFKKLLQSLDADREQAGERYEELRRMLTRFFEWRGAPFPDEHTDETFNRVARKLDEGIEIRNFGGYCYEVARLICLEAFKGRDVQRVPLDCIEIEAVADRTNEALEREMRLSCLEACLLELHPESRELIAEYYRDEKRARIDCRKALADRLGLQREALANRAQRLRDKLERCVIHCVRKKTGDMKSPI